MKRTYSTEVPLQKTISITEHGSTRYIYTDDKLRFTMRSFESLSVDQFGSLLLALGHDVIIEDGK